MMETMVSMSVSTYSLGCSLPASRLSISRRPDAHGPEWVWEQLIITFSTPQAALTLLRTVATCFFEKKSRSSVTMAISVLPSFKYMHAAYSGSWKPVLYRG